MCVWRIPRLARLTKGGDLPFDAVLTDGGYAQIVYFAKSSGRPLPSDRQC